VCSVEYRKHFLDIYSDANYSSFDECDWLNAAGRAGWVWK
jgi:hypothetical protein